MVIEPATDQGHKQDFQAHERDYSVFTKLFKYGAIFSFAVGLIVIFLIS